MFAFPDSNGLNQEVNMMLVSAEVLTSATCTQRYWFDTTRIETKSNRLAKKKAGTKMTLLLDLS